MIVFQFFRWRRFLVKEAPFFMQANRRPGSVIGYLFQYVAGSHQIPILMSDTSSVRSLAAADQRRWCGSFAVQEAAMYRRLLLIASLGLTLSACAPYYDEGPGNYGSAVYTSPAPAYYYGGGPYYSAPPARYYSSPRYYQPAPRYYQAPPRVEYRAYQNRGWDDRGRQGWGHHEEGGHGRRGWDDDGHRGRRDHDRRGDRDGHDRGGRN